LAGGIISISSPSSLNIPFSLAIIIGPWSGLINQSNNKVTFSLARTLLE